MAVPVPSTVAFSGCPSGAAHTLNDGGRESPGLNNPSLPPTGCGDRSTSTFCVPRYGTRGSTIRYPPNPLLLSWLPPVHTSFELQKLKTNLLIVNNAVFGVTM